MDKNDYNPEEIDLSKLNSILQPKKAFKLQSSGVINTHKMVLVFSQHRFYRHLVIELAEAELTLKGQPKNPLKFIDPSDLIWKSDQQDVLKFYSGISKFQNNYDAGKSESDLEGLKALVKNPLKLDVYVHDEKKSSTINAASIVPVQLKVLKADLILTVDQRADFYEVSGKLMLEDKAFSLELLKIRYHYFVEFKHTLYLIDNPGFLSVIDFFKQYNDTIQIHQSKFEAFQENVLSKLESRIRINYSYLKQATKKQIEEKGFDLENDQIVYLSESEDFVLITPVVRYGNLEIPVISKKQIRTKDKKGNTFTLARDESAELQLISNIAREHPFFYEQLLEFPEQAHADCFYLHKKRFIEGNWFLTAFEAWRAKQITILGFNQLKNNKLNPYKANISIHVISGIDWFETAIKVTFDQQTVSLKHLHRSIRNKSKFVQLDDGTTGILPDEWIEKFTSYFAAGEVVEEVIRTEKINYSVVEQLYEEEHLDEIVKDQLVFYRAKLSAFESIKDIPVPEGLNATLREYQKQGLNWLNFLDDFNFGACLADDMGLGKTIQVIAFILSQREKIQLLAKDRHNTNLIIVPASLIFNWQQEVARFAPSIKILTLYGTERNKIVHDFSKYEIILTSYGTLLSDIRFLKEYRFNYIFLDESQTIKNPESQRYKAVRLLQSRNKAVLTGTPIENNTYDLYGQLSFACPGLLGTREQFKQIYSVPIDQFKDSRRAQELQKKINPFILRRTKQQVATELPDKTEMVIYCEMGAEQRKVYDACKQDIRDFLMGRSEDELAKSTMHVLQGITKLRQICNSPALLKDEKFYGESSAKMDVLMEQIENKSSNHKILVFSQFVSMLDLIRKELEKRGIAFEYLTGQTRNRSAVVTSFQDNPDIRVFLISLKAGGTGLNLTQADYVYLVDPWWNPAVENQAIDRTYRIGQQKNVVAVRLICPDTIEEKIMTMQDSKKGLVTDLIKTEESIFKSLTKKDLLDLL
ncbi:DEAD/DEAH box helicase [Pedobacter metabolipauper]|uniref:SNF2 family DNA or RNA helicase n=1 Tax=Pedobacter metabolipauper TaxID=425513 RepID=A0A4R6SZ22_9SPHI|nr:DEAD/DEAH box helicase [Pedobacter metabolipauper]TDQ11307.1 SNF2 family DNA or RNA helicase [Pedobacter metabolipauper]